MFMLHVMFRATSSLWDAQLWMSVLEPIYQARATAGMVHALASAERYVMSANNSPSQLP